MNRSYVNKDSIKQALINYDTNIIRKITNTGKYILSVGRIDHFDPPNEFLDYIASVNNSRFIYQIYVDVLQSSDLDKVSYYIHKIIENLENSSDCTIMLVNATAEYYSFQ